MLGPALRRVEQRPNGELYLRGLLARAYGQHVPRGSMEPSKSDEDAVLSRETFISKFPQMLSGRPRFAAVTTAAGQTRLPNGMTLHAELGTPEEIIELNGVESERYRHGTRSAGQGDTISKRNASDWSLTIRPPVKPAVDLGVRFGTGGDRIRTEDPGSVSSATEHRAWLRLIPDKAYTIYVPATFTAVFPGGGGRTHRFSGAFEAIITMDGAVEMGIPIHLIRAAAIVAQVSGRGDGSIQAASDLVGGDAELRGIAETLERGGEADAVLRAEQAVSRALSSDSPRLSPPESPATGPPRCWATPWVPCRTVPRRTAKVRRRCTPA